MGDHIQLKNCSKCHIEKSSSEFHKQGNSLRSWCKECIKPISYKHYPRSEKWSLLQRGLKRCTKCGTTKRVEQFNKNGLTKGGKQKYSSDCKICSRNRAIDQVRDRNFRKHYGITLDDYKLMLAHQNNQCQICSTVNDWDGKILVVDHDHSTGVIRGLLCDTCNRALGFFKDNTDVLRNAIEYLQKERN